MSLPWWLNPWREARARYGEMIGLRAESAERYARLQASARELNRLRDTGDAADRQIAHQASQLVRYEGQIRSLRGQLAAAVTDAQVSGSALSTAQPEFVMVGIPRGPGMGKRLQVSRQLDVTAFAMTEPDNPPPRFKLGVIMGALLVIDKPTYPECLAHAATVWANADAEEGRRNAAAANRAYHGARGQIGRPTGPPPGGSDG